MNLIFILLGVLLLVAGRRLYWLFVAAVGFAIGLVLAQNYFGQDAAAGRDAWIAFAVAILGGIVGAILAVFFQKLAVGLAGAAAGGMGGWALFELIGGESIAWLGLILGAILGGILILKIFDWALIILSSLAGARLLIDGIQMERGEEAIVFLIAAAVGIVIQAIQFTRARPAPAHAREDSA